MIFSLMLPVLLLLLVIVQITVLEVFSLGRISMELSLIVVIYAGFHLNPLRGGIVSLLLGFFMDSLTSAIFGLYMFLYVFVFCISMLVGTQIYAGRPLLIACYTAFCTLLEGVVIVLIYRFVFANDILFTAMQIFIPQAIVLWILSPWVFGLLQRFEVLIHAENRRPAQRI